MTDPKYKPLDNKLADFPNMEINSFMKTPTIRPTANASTQNTSQASPSPQAKK